MKHLKVLINIEI